MAKSPAVAGFSVDDEEVARPDLHDYDFALAGSSGIAALHVMTMMAQNRFYQEKEIIKEKQSGS